MGSSLVEAGSLSEILAARGDQMAACRELPWLQGFVDVPADSAVPLAMSGAHPRAVGSYGAECIEWGKSELGVTPRWWQALAITRQLEHDADGALVYPEVIETGPRRIGKSTRLRQVALWRTANAERIGEKQLTMLVSKDLAVGKEIHRGSWRWAEKKSWKVIRLGGAQEVENPSDESRWLLRAENAVYGYDVGYGQVDESWGVDPQAITDGLEPALLERLWAQLHLTSTAHVKATSLMRRRLVAALRNADPNVLLLFWGAHPDADLSAESTWKASSPYWTSARRDLIARKYAAALAGDDDPEFDDPDPVRGWAAQYLNVWPLLIGGDGAGVLPGWEDRAVQALEPVPFALGVAVAWGGRHTSLAVAGMAGDRLILGADERRPGTDWVPELVRGKQERTGCYVVVDEVGPTARLIPALEAAGVKVTRLNTPDVAAGCSSLEELVRDDRVSHPGHPDLDQAVAVAAKRDVGERGWAWARKISTGDISMLEAATNAAWIATTSTVPTVW